MSVQEVAERLYDVLSACLSDETQTRAWAEAQLKGAEQRPDFFASLAMILCAAEGDAEPKIRWLAAVCGKNAVPRIWKRRGSKREAISISDEEREYVHGALIAAIGVHEPTVAVQVSVWIARISRVDFPDDWPTLIDDLARLLSSPNPPVMCHALVTLDMVFKQLASRRLLSDRKSFQQVTSSLFGVLLGMLCSHIALVGPLDQIRAESPSFVVIERCLKSLRRLIVHGMTTIYGVKDIEVLFGNLTSLPALFFNPPGVQNPAQARFTLLAAKLVVRTHERHPVDFHVYLPHFLNVYYSQIISFDAPVVDRIGFHAARFLRNVAQCVEYKISRETIDALANGQSLAETPTEKARQIVLLFYGQERTKPLLEAILSRIFVFSQQELQTWIDDPETLLLEEEASEWGGESMRHECEELFKTLLVRDKQNVSSVLLKYTDAVGLHQQILLDACYRAIGKCVYDISDSIQFESWFQNQLAPILVSPRTQDIGQIVLKARAAWLVGQFVGQLSRESRPSVYSKLIPLMSLVHEDAVVALMAAKAMQMLVEDLGFYGTDFTPYLQTCLSQTFEMSARCESVETKRDLLGFASSVVDRSPVTTVQSILDPVAEALPKMWLQASEVKSLPSLSRQDDEWGASGTSGSENLFRTSIVLLLTSFVRKVGPPALANPAMRELCLRVVEYGTDVSGVNSGGVFMLDEVCELWDAVISAVDIYSPDIAAMYPRIGEVLSHDFDNLKMMFRIVEGYALLGGLPFMQQYGESMSQLLGGALEQLKDRGRLAACEVIDLVLQKFPKDGPVLFAKILQRCLNLAASGHESRNLSAAYVGLVLRSVLCNVECVEGEVLVGDGQAMGALMDLALSRLDNMYLTRRRKLAALALCTIVARHGAQNVAVQNRVPLVLNAVVQVLSEIRSSPSGRGREARKSDFDNFLSRVGEEDVERVEARLGADMPGSVRRNVIHADDPCENVDLSDVAREALAMVRNANADAYSRIISTTDSEVMGQLQSLFS